MPVKKPFPLFSLPRFVLISLVFFLAAWRRSLFGPSCRFRPTCSQYACQALERYGILKGGFLSLKRFFRCRPGQPGGWDPLI